jgi:hypothetical protein
MSGFSSRPFRDDDDTRGSRSTGPVCRAAGGATPAATATASSVKPGVALGGLLPSDTHGRVSTSAAECRAAYAEDSTDLTGSAVYDNIETGSGAA